MRLLYGTTNPAKLAAMRRWLAPLSIELIGVRDLPGALPEPDETGHSPLENARIKAAFYRDLTGMTTLSADSGLYIDGLPDELQPADHPRRMNGRRMNDDEMTDYYARLAASRGGRMVARYRNALAIAFADGGVIDRFDDTVASEPFYIVDTPHPRRTEGFPLDSLSVEIQSGLYYNDLQQYRMDCDLVQINGYAAFVREGLRI